MFRSTYTITYSNSFNYKEEGKVLVPRTLTQSQATELVKYFAVHPELECGDFLSVPCVLRI